MIEIILAGRPNSGKSTLFNSIAMGNQKVANYAGCTVEKKTSVVKGMNHNSYELTDLPGIYSLQPNSLDEEVALKHLAEKKGVSPIVFVLDGNNLEQELVLPLMLKEQGHYLIIAVNMMDEVRASKKILDLAGMVKLAGIPFFPVAAKTGEGVEALKKFLSKISSEDLVHTSSSALDIHQMRQVAKQKAKQLNTLNQSPQNNFLLERDKKLDFILLHRWLGPVIFFVVMFILFQSIFTWAAPLSDILDNTVIQLQDFTKEMIKNEFIASLVADGILAGVGSVIVFIPQIAILFFLIGLLEYSGYLPRVAYMVDRFMKPYGLDGKVFIPLLSSVACAVPGIMATRTIESEKTRIITIMISPLMTCSARLPVYTLLIASFIPASHFGPFQLQGLVMFSMYLIAVFVALAVALILHKLEFHNRKHLVDFIHLPHYRTPNWIELFRYVKTRVMSFVKKAGTIIAGMSILLWVLLSFPKTQMPLDMKANEWKQILEKKQRTEEEQKIVQFELQKEAAFSLENSYAGKIGKWMEPVFQPIGYDWRLTIGILSSLAAREVFVSTLGTVFSLGDVDENSQDLAKTLREAKGEDGKPAYTIATCLSLLLFFAFSLQCISTIGIAHKETNSWRIPFAMFVYMFMLAYSSAFIAYRVGQYFL